ncbi:MAG: SEC-C domain-containing protein [Acidobacteriota bacterium]
MQITGDAEPYRPTCVAWIELPEEVVVAFDLCQPDDACEALGKALLQAIRNPLVGRPRKPQRIRVADEHLAVEAKRVVGELIPVTIAATPELEVLAAAMLGSVMNDSAEESTEEPAGYLGGGRVSHDAVSELFDAADDLGLAAPWTIVGDQQLLRLDIPALGVEGACVSIIGALGQTLGLLIFPSHARYEAFERVATRPRRKSSRIDLGTSWLSLTLVSREELPHACRREIIEHGWSPADASRFPQVEHWTRDGILEPPSERDVRIVSACAASLSAFFSRNREALESGDVEPISESYDDGTGLIVRFTMPYEAFSLFDDAHAVPVPSEASRRSRKSRNDRCHCGSGKKYKLCHRDEDRSRASGVINFPARPVFTGAQTRALPEPPPGYGRDEVPVRETGPIEVPKPVPTPGRNDRCPCGSGKKYKHCCLLSSETTEFKRRQVHRAAEEVSVAAAKLITRLDVADPVRTQAEEFWEIALNVGIDLDDSPEQASVYELMAPLFLSWLVYSFRPLVLQEGSKRRRRRKTAAELLLQQEGKRLDPLQAKYAQSALASPLSFWIVEQITPGTSIELRSAFTNERTRVTDTLLSQDVRRGEVVFSRVVALDGFAVVDGCAGMRITPDYLPWILDLKYEIHTREGGLTLAIADRYLQRSLRLYFQICADVITPRMPIMQNTDGELLVPVEMRFDLTIPIEEAFEKLKTLALDIGSLDDLASNEIRRAPDGSIRELTLTWAKRGNNMHSSWQNTSLGSIRLNRGSIHAEVNSHERARLLRHEIEARLGEAVRHRASGIQSLERALQDSIGTEVPAAEPSEDFAEVLREMKRQHSESWVDQKIPALGNLTPREAMHEPRARERLEALLMEFEWRTERSGSDRTGFDLDLIRERLGLNPS